MIGFAPKDLTVVVPTLGRDVPLLEAVLRVVHAAGVNVCVVWDGHAPPDEGSRDVIEAAAPGVRLLVHERNRGLSAARNTGAQAVRSPLTMFVDDDIVPRSDFAASALRFHEQHPDRLAMAMGCVTWRGTPFRNALTEWFETSGNWSVFHQSVEGQPLSNFMGGFTTFKTEVLHELRFDETFVRYGCEDTEFGYRFFKRGGSLIYWPTIHGGHHKPLDLEAYLRDHRGAGHSRGVLLGLHPDTAFDLGLVYRALAHRLPSEAFERLVAAATHFIDPSHAPHCAAELGAVLGTLTEHAILHGLAEYLLAAHPEFARVQPGATLEAVLDATGEFAPFLVERARRSDSPELRRSLLEKAAALMPNYAQPLLARFEDAGPDDSASRAAIEGFLARCGERIDARTERKLKRALGHDDAPPAARLSARDLFFQMEEARAAGRTASVHELACAVLERDPSFVGAYVAWAAALEPSSRLRSVLVRLAEHFLRARPPQEQAARAREIQSLRTEAGMSRVEGKNT